MTSKYLMCFLQYFPCTGCHCCIMTDFTCILQLKAWESRFTWGRGQLPSVCFQASSSDRIPHDTPTERHAETNLTESYWVCAPHVFQFIKMNFNISICHPCCSSQHKVVEYRDHEHQAETEKHAIKDCYSKIDFEVIQTVCMCIGRFHYSSTILHQMSTQMLYTSLFSPLLNRNSHVFPHARTWHARAVLLIHLMHNSQFLSLFLLYLWNVLIICQMLV